MACGTQIADSCRYFDKGREGTCNLYKEYNTLVRGYQNIQGYSKFSLLKLTQLLLISVTDDLIVKHLLIKR